MVSVALLTALVSLFVTASTVDAHSGLICAQWTGAKDTGTCTATPRLRASQNHDGYFARNNAFKTVEPCGSSTKLTGQTVQSASTLIPQYKAGQPLRLVWPSRNHAVANQSPRTVQVFLSAMHANGLQSTENFPGFPTMKDLGTAPFMSEGSSCLGGSGNDNPCFGNFTLPSDLQPGIYTFVWAWDWTVNDGSIYTNCADIQVTASDGTTPATSSSPSASAPATVASPSSSPGPSSSSSPGSPPSSTPTPTQSPGSSPAAVTPSPSPSPASAVTSPSATPSPQTSTIIQPMITYSIAWRGDGVFGAKVIFNPRQTVQSSWSISYSVANQKVLGTYGNVAFSNVVDNILFKSTAASAIVASGSSIEFGFNAKFDGKTPQAPMNVIVVIDGVTYGTSTSNMPIVSIDEGTNLPTTPTGSFQSITLATSDARKLGASITVLVAVILSVMMM